MKFDKKLQRGWSRMVVKQFQDGGRPPFWKSIYRRISSEKSFDFHEILSTAVYFEPDERHVIKKWKSCIGQSPSSTERISCFFFTNSAFFLPASTAKVVYQQIKKWFRRVNHQISGCEYIGRCLSVPLSQQNLVSTIALQPFEMQTWNFAGV